MVQKPIDVPTELKKILKKHIEPVMFEPYSGRLASKLASDLYNDAKNVTTLGFTSVWLEEETNTLVAKIYYGLDYPYKSVESRVVSVGSV